MASNLDVDQVASALNDAYAVYPTLEQALRDRAGDLSPRVDAGSIERSVVRQSHDLCHRCGLPRRS